MDTNRTESTTGTQDAYVLPDGGTTTAGPGGDQTGSEVQIVEGARLLANDARPQLEAAGLSEQDIDQLADEYAAAHPGEAEADTEAFIAWATRRVSHTL